MIDYGDRLRVGAVVPSGNSVAEPELAAMLPPGVALHVTRLPLVGSSPAELERMAAGLDDATDLLADVRPDVLLFHCTAVTTAAPAAAEEMRRRMAERGGAPALTTGGTLLDALHRLDAGRVALLTPYVASVHTAEVAFLASHGVDVVVDGALGIDTNREMAGLAPRDLEAFVLEHRGDVDAYVLSCTAIRSGGVIEALESELGRPVVTSNQAAAWGSLRAGGIVDPVAGYGRLLTLA